jgi:hypothetical protein
MINDDDDDDDDDVSRDVIRICICLHVNNLIGTLLIFQ